MNNFLGIKYAYVKVKDNDFTIVDVKKIPELKLPFDPFTKYWVVDGEDRYISVFLCVVGNSTTFYYIFVFNTGVSIQSFGSLVSKNFLR